MVLILFWLHLGILHKFWLGFCSCVLGLEVVTGPRKEVSGAWLDKMEMELVYFRAGLGPMKIPRVFESENLKCGWWADVCQNSTPNQNRFGLWHVREQFRVVCWVIPPLLTAVVRNAHGTTTCSRQWNQTTCLLLCMAAVTHRQPHPHVHIHPLAEEPSHAAHTLNCLFGFSDKSGPEPNCYRTGCGQWTKQVDLLVTMTSTDIQSRNKQAWAKGMRTW